MFSHFAKRLTNYFIKNKYIEIESKEIYDYYFEVMLSTIFNAIILLIMALVFKLYLETLFFSITFVVFRGTCGGVHANTHLGCILGLVIMYIFYVCLIFYIVVLFPVILIIIMLTTASILILLLCPVDNINKTLDENEIKIFKKRARIALLIFVLLCCLLLFFSKHFWAFSVVYPMLVVSLMLVVGAIKNRKIKKYDKVLFQ